MVLDFAEIPNRTGIQYRASRVGQVARHSVAGLIFILLAACSGGGGSAQDFSPSAPAVEPSALAPTIPTVAPAAAVSSSGLDYTLGSGDKLRVIVFGEQDLSGEFDVTGTGKVSLPLIGQVQATGLTLNQFEDEIANKLKEGYLTSPKVSVEVLNYRPFYIIGEVDKPGEYPYTNGMSVLNAVAVAGGFTYRARQDQVFITRGGDAEREMAAGQTVPVLPGDIVRIPERFF